MLAAVVLASWWSQAEPAPPTPPPAWAAPSATPPAPAPPPPPAGLQRPNGLTLHGQFAYRLGSEGEALGPAAGFSVGGVFQRTYLAFPAGLELGGAVEFFYDRFAQSASGPAPMNPGQVTFDERSLSHTSFALAQIFAWRTARVRPFVGIAAGATMSYFATPEEALQPGRSDAVQPLLRGLVGASVPVSSKLAVVIRADYTHLFTRPTFTTDGGVTYSILGNLFHAGAGLEVRF